MLNCRLRGKPEPPLLHPIHLDPWPVSWDVWHLSPTRRMLWGEIPLLAQVPLLESKRWTWGRCGHFCLQTHHFHLFPDPGFRLQNGGLGNPDFGRWGNSQPLPRSLHGGGFGKPGFWLPKQLAGMMAVTAKRLMDGCDVPHSCCRCLPARAGNGNG